MTTWIIIGLLIAILIGILTVCRKSSIKNCIAIAALAVSIIAIVLSTYWHFRQEERIKQIQGAQNRPLLNVLSTPEVYSFRGKTIEPIPIQDLEEARKKKEFLHISVSLTLNTKITVINQGSSIAILRAWILTDIPTGDPDIRKELLDVEKRKKWKIQLTDEYYKTLSILSGEEHTFDLSHTIGSIDKNREFTLHYYFLYQDELNNIYDSYYWARYTTEEIGLTPEELKRPYHFKDKHFATKMYFDKEYESISNFLNNIKLEQDKE